MRFLSVHDAVWRCNVMMNIILALVFSFTCTCGFGICFGIKPQELYLAGLGGIVTRIVLMICEPVFPDRFVYTLIAAAVATVFAEIVGRKRNASIAKYLYPALVLLIPGDVLYELIMAMIQTDLPMINAKLILLVEGLAGIALGCMIVPMVVRNIVKEPF